MEYDKRGLIIEASEVASYAENLARGIRVAGICGGGRAAAALRRTLRALDDAHDALALKWADVPSMPGAARWLLDNRWLLRREGLAAARSLAAAQHLRCGAGGTVLESLCAALVASGRGALEDARIAGFLSGFQRVLILEREELALLSAGLTAALLRALETLYRDLAEGGETDPEAEAARLIGALRELGSRDLQGFIEAADAVEQTLLADPAGVYPRMAERSRAYYRRTLSELARRRGIPEHMAARRVLTLAEGGRGAQKHVGWWLLRAPLGETPKERGGACYIAANVLLTLFFTLLAAFAVGSPPAAALLLIPVSELVKQAIDFVLLRVTPPAHVPRLALPGGVPPEGRTLCVISALLTDAQDVPALAGALEEARLLNRDAGENLLFALLADLPESRSPAVPEAAERALRAAKTAVDALNARCGGGFLLLTRPRTRCAEGIWRGWERKRGALLETMRLLRGRESGVSVAAGDAAALRDVRFLLALDSDTRMSPGAAKELIGAMLHPLSRPTVDAARGTVTAGWGILSPRVGTALSAAVRTDFSRIFAGPGGADPYGGACSELRMDYFGRSGFSGKGILDVDAYLACLDTRIPENLTLSHDAVEAAFLRCGFVGDVEVLDGFPGGVLSYLRRQERWTRGDWQNLPWLGRLGRGLPEGEKWTLLDAARRSLVPVSTLAALAVGFFCAPAPGIRLVAAAATLCAARELVFAGAEALLQRDAERGVRFRSAVFTGVGGALVRTLLRLLLLPAEASACGGAALRALWRMGISRRGLLRWQTAGDSDRRRNGPLQCFYALPLAPLLGVLLLAFAPGVIAKAAGLLWLLSPLCAWLLSLPAAPPTALRPEERDYLLGCARETWQYYVNFITTDDNALPPDNVQAQPPTGAAHRCSPTNIGLTLLSILSAMDLGLEPPEAGLARIAALTDTLERMEKWNGHLYNWYDTRTLSPLAPRYVSTVDSGNLCACLIAARAALAEYGAETLARRVGALAEAMGFAPLFDAQRRLFYIGLEPGKPPADARYDLMASEARLTSYLAVARGDVPRAHWRRLSRAQLQYGPYRGMASWTGTMFEYLMPELLLPVQRHSLLWESARFCLYVQRRRVRGTGLPWGVSESAFRSLDPGMSWRYKAHGCARLALKRGMDAELVLSPYSSFLALAVRPHAAIRNLRALEALGARGPWGFWDAVDCTPERCGDAPKTVRAVFAHHAGMSLLAVANALTDGRMQRRFCADSAMRAWLGLLAERVSVGGTVLRGGADAERARPPKPSEGGRWTQSGEGTDVLRPACCLLAGQSYTLLCAETGLTRARWGQLAPYVSPLSPLERGRGVELALEYGGKTLPLLPEGGAEGGVRRGWRFASDRAEFFTVAPAEGLTAACCVTLAEDDAGERREVRLRSAGALSAEVTLRFRPLLAKETDWRSHPAYWGLGLSARTENGCLLLRRLARGRERELWLCLAPDKACSFDLAPGAESGRAGGAVRAGAAEYFLTEPLVTASCPVSLAPGEETALRFALGMAYTAADALAAAGRILRSEAAADLPRSAARVLGMDARAVSTAFALLPELCFPAKAAKPALQSSLWACGVSGDLPIAAAYYENAGQLDAAKALLDAHLFLCGCGLSFDLVFLSRDGASYLKPLGTALSDALWRRGGSVLRDAPGGVHIVEDGPASAAVAGCAAMLLPLDRPWDFPPRDGARRLTLPAPPRRPLQELPRYRFSEDGFDFYVNHSLPPRSWALPLTNGRFGYLATDCGTGHLWYGNAREAQLTPWRGLASATEGPERITLEHGGMAWPLFAAPEDRACRVRYAPGVAVWEKRCGALTVRTTAFVPPETDARVLLIELSDVPDGACIRWDAELLLCSRAEDARFCRAEKLPDGCAVENLRGGPFAFRALSVPAPSVCLLGRAAALTGDAALSDAEAAEPGFSLRVPAARTCVLVCGCDSAEALRALASPVAARAALARTRQHWRERTGGLLLRSPSAPLNNYVNHWCACQVLACRLMARTGLYQCGGALGFRDQLQDAVNLMVLDPAPAREQILRCCARQYAEGDVQHWWHPLPDGTLRGLRTRCSDDLLWLPWALCEYVERSGDRSLCAEALPYLLSPPLSPEERDRFEAPRSGDRSESVLRHCQRALRLVMDRGRGAHGLLRMGAGDWNDGFDAVGGESVWLSWFFLHVAERFAALAPELAPPERFVRELAEAANAAWDGDHFLRGWYADGSPLGASANAECRIDSVAQSWAAFCACADGQKVDIALDTAYRRLFDAAHGLTKLFDPPFAGAEQPGYIASYGPGFRENGGQYTHAALWLAMALLRRGRRDEAWDILAALLPGGKTCAVYKAEPYVLAADIYSAPGHVGEGGWSWYTGAAGWMLRIVTEELLGLRRREGRLEIKPQLPKALEGTEAEYQGRRVI